MRFKIEADVSIKCFESSEDESEVHVYNLSLIDFTLIFIFSKKLGLARYTNHFSIMNQGVFSPTRALES